jgi:hypothetical protein
VGKISSYNHGLVAITCDNALIEKRQEEMFEQRWVSAGLDTKECGYCRVHLCGAGYYSRSISHRLAIQRLQGAIRDLIRSGKIGKQRLGVVQSDT